jgi:hypothetical protein
MRVEKQLSSDHKGTTSPNDLMTDGKFKQNDNSQRTIHSSSLIRRKLLPPRQSSSVFVVLATPVFTLLSLIRCLAAATSTSVGGVSTLFTQLDGFSNDHC